MKVNSVYLKGTLKIRIIQNLAPMVMLWTDSAPVASTTWAACWAATVATEDPLETLNMLILLKL